jgi:D-alanyl-D-alanine carboxypeptidase
MRLINPVSLLLVFAVSIAGTMAAAPASPTAELQSLLHKAVAAGVPGISTAVANSKGVVWTGVAGKANLATGAPVQPDTLFGIGSITKTFVAVVILQLAEEGKLDLNATASSLLGSAVESVPNADKASLAQLMNHNRRRAQLGRRPGLDP